MDIDPNMYIILDQAGSGFTTPLTNPDPHTILLMNATTLNSGLVAGEQGRLRIQL
jgi:hypothetical protein